MPDTVETPVSFPNVGFLRKMAFFFLSLFVPLCGRPRASRFGWRSFPGKTHPTPWIAKRNGAARSVIGPFVVPKHRELPGDSNDSVLSVELPATWEIGRRVRSLGRRRGGQEWDPNRGRITVLLSSTISCALRYSYLCSKTRVISYRNTVIVTVTYRGSRRIRK